MGQCYPIYACTRADHARYSSVSLSCLLHSHYTIQRPTTFEAVRCFLCNGGKPKCSHSPQIMSTPESGTDFVFGCNELSKFKH